MDACRHDNHRRGYGHWCPWVAKGIVCGCVYVCVVSICVCSVFFFAFKLMAKLFSPNKLYPSLQMVANLGWVYGMTSLFVFSLAALYSGLLLARS